MKRLRKPLQEQSGAGTFDRELARSQSRSFRTLGPDAPGHFTPAAAYGFHDHGDETDSLCLALGAGVTVAALEIFVAFCDAARIVHSVGWQVRAEPRSDGKVPGSWWAQPPPGHIDVSRATRSGVAVLLANTAPTLIRGTAEGPVGKEPRLFQLRVQFGSFCGMENHIAK